MVRQLAAALAPHHPLFIEEPLLPGQIEGIKQLAGQTSIPLRWEKDYFPAGTAKPILKAPL